MSTHLNRRRFLQGAAAVVGTSYAAGRGVAIVFDRADRTPVASWAVHELQNALTDRGVSTRVCERVSQAGSGDLCIVTGLGTSQLARGILRDSGASLHDGAETVAIVNGKAEGRSVLLASGGDVRGLSYAVLELADRVQHSADPLAALSAPKPILERPANRIRSVNRLFTSDVEDKPWFNDREMWPRYFTMLAAQRFNRFHLALGIGYDFLRNVTDAYFLFPYPFLLPVDGYKVRVPQLPDAERDHNLETLRFISEQAVARGIDFQ